MNRKTGRRKGKLVRTSSLYGVYGTEYLGKVQNSENAFSKLTRDMKEQTGKRATFDDATSSSLPFPAVRPSASLASRPDQTPFQRVLSIVALAITLGLIVSTLGWAANIAVVPAVAAGLVTAVAVFTKFLRTHD